MSTRQVWGDDRAMLKQLQGYGHAILSIQQHGSGSNRWEHKRSLKVVEVKLDRKGGNINWLSVGLTNQIDFISC